MAKIITRFFESTEKAKITRHELVEMQRLPPVNVKILSSADDVDAMMGGEAFEKATVQEYKKRLKKGGAVMMVRAGYQPLGVARITRDTMAQMGAADLGDLVEEIQVKDEIQAASDKILPSHPRFFTRLRDPDSDTYHMANWPIPLLSRREPSNLSLFPQHARMASWPMGLLAPSTKRYGRFPFGLLVPRQRYMAKFPFAHIVPGHRFMAKFPFGHLVPGHKFMAKFPFAHLVPGHRFMAKFPFGHLVPGHARMARWPFPLLINEEQGTNSLVPGHKFMAKFPFAHLVPGHKFMAKFPFAHIVPGHKFMAKFPFDHIVPGHKFMARFPIAHIVPGHKYMANFVYPHTKSA